MCGQRFVCRSDCPSGSLQTAKEHQALQAAKMLDLTHPFHSLSHLLGLPTHGALYFLLEIYSLLVKNHIHGIKSKKVMLQHKTVLYTVFQNKPKETEYYLTQ